MTDKAPQVVGDRYVLPTGPQDAARLDLIHAVYAPISYRGLEAARIEDAKRAADIGCGTGTISRWMAAHIGSTGQVDSIDISEEQIEVARNSPSAPDSAPIHYRVGSAYDPRLPAQEYDIVFCRLVLCHLREPEKALDQMARLLKPGGRVVLIDMDLRDIFTMPSCEAFSAFHREVTAPLEAKLHVDYSIGLRLPELLGAAGLSPDAVLADQPIYKDGPEKFLWTTTWTSVLQRAVPEGVISLERGSEIISILEQHIKDPTTWMAVAKMFAAVGSRPVSARSMKGT